jgi:hypothetical protein
MNNQPHVPACPPSSTTPDTPQSPHESLIDQAYAQARNVLPRLNTIVTHALVTAPIIGTLSDDFWRGGGSSC